MNLLTVFLPCSPELCWFVKKSDVPWLKNPGLREGTEPLNGYDLAVAMERVAKKIRLRDYRMVMDGENIRYELSIDSHDLCLSAIERKIIAYRWFSKDECIGIDPWDNGVVVDGRHRLWACLDAKPDAELPIYSYLLTKNLLIDQAEDDPAEEDKLAESIIASRALEVLDEEFWRRNPLLKIALDERTTLAQQIRQSMREEEYRNFADSQLTGKAYHVLGYSNKRNQVNTLSSNNNLRSRFLNSIKEIFARL